MLAHVHEFALELDLAVIHLERMEEMVLVKSFGITVEENLSVAVALDPKEVWVVGFEDFDVIPFPVRKTFQRPDGVFAELLLSANDNR